MARLTAKEARGIADKYETEKVFQPALDKVLDEIRSSAMKGQRHIASPWSKLRECDDAVDECKRNEFIKNALVELGFKVRERDLNRHIPTNSEHPTQMVPTVAIVSW